MSGVLNVLLAPTAASGGTTGTAWDPSKKAVGLVLSNSNYTCLWPATSSGYRGLKSVSSKTGSGKYYWEIKNTGLISIDQNNPVLGLADSGFNIDNNRYLGQDPISVGLFFETELIVNGTNLTAATAGFNQSIATNDVVQFALDMDNNKMWFGLNNTYLSGDPAAGTSPSVTGTGLSATTWFIAAEINDVAAAYQITLQTSSGSLSFTPPSGFSVWT